MLRIQLRPLLASATLVVALSGCDDSPVLQPHENTHPLVGVASDLFDNRRLGLIRGSETPFHDIAASVPGFAGAYFESPESEAILVLRYVGSELATESAALIRKAVFEGSRRKDTSIKFVPATYSFAQLATWRDSLFDRTSDFIYTLDLDEQSNAINFGLRDAAFAEVIARAAGALGVPAAAIRTHVAPKPEFRANLTDKVRPVVGGLAIAVGNLSLNKKCSAGVNGEWSYSSQYRGFVTASHCSLNFMQLDVPANTNFFQNATINDNTQVAYEFDDPTYFTGGICAGVRRCRMSDALFARYLDNNASGLGKIARTQFAGTGAAGSKRIVGSFTVVGEFPYSIVNEQLHKVGYVTGWTTGSVTATCVDSFGGYGPGGSEYWVLCTDESSIYSTNGDSGSPIFKWYGGADSTVLWAGILSGGPDQNPNVTRHSPVSSILAELTGTYGWYW